MKRIFLLGPNSKWLAAAPKFSIITSIPLTFFCVVLRKFFIGHPDSALTYDLCKVSPLLAAVQLDCYSCLHRCCVVASNVTKGSAGFVLRWHWMCLTVCMCVCVFFAGQELCLGLGEWEPEGAVWTLSRWGECRTLFISSHSKAHSRAPYDSTDVLLTLKVYCCSFLVNRLSCSVELKIKVLMRSCVAQGVSNKLAIYFRRSSEGGGGELLIITIHLGSSVSYFSGIKISHLSW